MRWELDLRGHGHVQIYVSGGIDEDQMANLNQYVDGYGVGTTISNARVLDFAMDIMEVEGTAFAKRERCPAPRGCSGARDAARTE